MAQKNDWFRVDKEGLAQVYARRGPAAPFFELLSNALDEEGVTEIRLIVTATPGVPEVEIRCTDNSTHGFRDLDDAFTLFAPSYKKGEAEQRGRFNVGEKLFLALCKEATILSTGGTLGFQSDGSLKRTRGRRDFGTEIYAKMRMTRDEAIEAYCAIGRIYVPEGVTVHVSFRGFSSIPNEHDLRQLIPCGLTFNAQLQTELSDGEGVIRPTERIGHVEVWDCDHADDGWLFEMGIPVVEIGGPFDLNVQQKVPLNVERDNVKPAFLRRLRAYVLNYGYARIETKTSANVAWVTEAMGSTKPKPSFSALDHILGLRFGERRVAYDPSDREGSQIAMSKGYTVVHGGSLPAEAWENVRHEGALRPAGQVTPSKSGNCMSSIVVSPEDVPGAPEVIALFKSLARNLIGESIQVTLIESDADVLADYGAYKMRLNVQRLGHGWFKRVLDDGRLSQDHVELLVHELGHEFVSSHLDAGFHESQTRLGVKLAFLAVAVGFGADLFDVKPA